VDLNDRILNQFHEAFISGSHAHLLEQVDKEELVSPRKDKKGKGGRRGKKGKSGKDENTFTKNEIEERQQEIKEISEEITENMKYLVENKYSLQLKKMRKKKDVVIEQDQQELLNKQLKLGIVSHFTSRCKYSQEPKEKGDN